MILCSFSKINKINFRNHLLLNVHCFMKKKILFVANRIPYPLNDGGNIATWHNIHALKQRGWETHLAVLNTKKHHQDPKNVADIASIHAVDIDTSISLIDAFKNLFDPQIPYNISRFWSPTFANLLKNLVEKYQFDIIQFEGIYLSIYIKAIRQGSDKVPIVLRAHNVEGEIWKRLSLKSGNFIKRIILSSLSSQILTFEQKWIIKYNGVVFISKKDQSYFVNSVKKNQFVTTIPAGVIINEKKVDKTYSREANSLCFIGSLEWLPNLEGVNWFLDNVWEKVLKANKNAHFHIAGKNPPPSIINLKRSSVHVHGMVPSSTEFVNNYVLLIVPLLSGSGMRLKIVEALATGQCIVSTSIGAEGIPYTDSEHLLIADDPQEMADKIVHLLKDKQAQEEMRSKALQLAKAHFDWTVLGAQFEKFYEKLI